VAIDARCFVTMRASTDGAKMLPMTLTAAFFVRQQCGPGRRMLRGDVRVAVLTNKIRVRRGGKYIVSMAGSAIEYICACDCASR
jgi:hypothetical protein